MAPTVDSWRHLAICDQDERIFKHFYRRFGSIEPNQAGITEIFFK
jgi:hypothetical protein